MIALILSIGVLSAAVQAMATRQTNDTTTAGVPYIEDAAFMCGGSNEAQCAELQFCEWKAFLVNPDCFENEDLVERINDIACAALTEAICSTDARCEWDDDECQGQHGAISVVKDANGTITLDTTGITLPPTGSIYVDVENYCLSILDKTTCDANQYCDFDDDVLGDEECEDDDNSVEDANQLVCASLTPALCLADLRCELDDNVCEGGDSFVIVPMPATNASSPTAATTSAAATSTDAPVTTTSATVAPGTPSLVVPDVICESYTNQTVCIEIIFCEWDDGRCEADEDTVKLINDASCVALTTEETCNTNTACDWEDAVCEGSEDAISVITNADGSISAEMTGVTVPATGTFQNAGKYCDNKYTDEVACGADKYCKWDNGVGGDECEADESLIEAENTPICAAFTTAALCAADMRCDWDDNTCEGTDDMIIA